MEQVLAGQPFTAMDVADIEVLAGPAVVQENAGASAPEQADCVSRATIAEGARIKREL